MNIQKEPIKTQVMKGKRLNYNSILTLINL